MKKIIILILVALSYQADAQLFKSRYEKDIAKAVKAADAALDTPARPKAD